MKTKIIFGIFLMIAILLGCSKKDEIKIIMKESGFLTVKVTNGDTPVPNAKVFIEPNMSMMMKASIEYSIDMVITDELGVADFGELNSGVYEIEVEEVDINGVEANPERLIQIVTDVSKEYTINVPDFIGSFDIVTKVWDGQLGEYVPVNANIAIVEYNDYNTVSSIEDRIDLARATGTSGANGEVSINIPSGFSYIVIAYTEDLGVIVLSATSSSYGIEKDEEQRVVLNLF